MRNKKTAYKAIKTPISDFLDGYRKKNSVRAHMPGHKGKGEFNAYDVTEIDGADSLYGASGIIAESEKTASGIFGANTFYSTEGSSHCIRAMVRLICEYAYSKGNRPLILATRNSHKSFITALAVCDCDAIWLYGDGTENYLSCNLSSKTLDKTLEEAEVLPTAVYITSPDYLGNTADIKAIASVCKKHGVLLAVDNAHGAYLKFLTPSAHPIDLGADLCADSAHKTLPALTGSAYLHISRSAPEILTQSAKSALALFGSTSPSYLILRSLDRLNLILSNGYERRLKEFCTKLKALKSNLKGAEYTLVGNEELKITVLCQSYGYSGYEIGKYLVGKNVFPDFYDDAHLVMMFTPDNTDKDLRKVLKALSELPKKQAITNLYPHFCPPARKLKVADAYKRATKTVATDEALGEILADAEISCPPAVPIAVAGELIDENVLSALKFYGVKKVKIVK